MSITTYSITKTVNGKNLQLCMGSKIFEMDFESACKLGDDLQTIAYKYMLDNQDENIVPDKLKFLINIGAIDRIELEDASEMNDRLDEDTKLYRITAWTKQDKEERYGDRRQFFSEIRFSNDKEKFESQIKQFGVPISFIDRED